MNFYFLKCNHVFSCARNIFIQVLSYLWTVWLKASQKILKTILTKNLLTMNNNKKAMLSCCACLILFSQPANATSTFDNLLDGIQRSVSIIFSKKAPKKEEKPEEETKEQAIQKSDLQKAKLSAVKKELFPALRKQMRSIASIFKNTNNNVQAIAPKLQESSQKACLDNALKDNKNLQKLLKRIQASERESKKILNAKLKLELAKLQEKTQLSNRCRNKIKQAFGLLIGNPSDAYKKRIKKRLTNATEAEKKEIIAKLNFDLLEMKQFLEEHATDSTAPDSLDKLADVDNYLLALNSEGSESLQSLDQDEATMLAANNDLADEVSDSIDETEAAIGSEFSANDYKNQFEAPGTTDGLSQSPSTAQNEADATETNKEATGAANSNSEKPAGTASNKKFSPTKSNLPGLKIAKGPQPKPATPPQVVNTTDASSNSPADPKRALTPKEELALLKAHGPGDGDEEEAQPITKSPDFSPAINEVSDVKELAKQDELKKEEVKIKEPKRPVFGGTITKKDGTIVHTNQTINENTNNPPSEASPPPRTMVSNSLFKKIEKINEDQVFIDCNGKKLKNILKYIGFAKRMIKDDKDNAINENDTDDNKLKKAFNLVEAQGFFASDCVYLDQMVAAYVTDTLNEGYLKKIKQGEQPALPASKEDYDKVQKCMGSLRKQIFKLKNEHNNDYDGSASQFKGVPEFTNEAGKPGYKSDVESLANKENYSTIVSKEVFFNDRRVRFLTCKALDVRIDHWNIIENENGNLEFPDKYFNTKDGEVEANIKFPCGCALSLPEVTNKKIKEEVVPYSDAEAAGNSKTIPTEKTKAQNTRH